MATKRMTTYIVSMRWKLPDGTHLTRKIAENGLTAQSAKHKVVEHYSKQSMVKRLGKATVISVVRK